MSLRKLPGQSKLAEHLCTAIQKGRLSHAYLILGPRGSGRARLAAALGTAVLCEDPVDGDACGRCRSCKRIPQGNHPDFHVYEPGQTDTQFKRETIEELCTAVTRRAFEGGAKVFIMKRAELLNPTSANRLLKTLEEPPKGTLLCLLAGSAHGLLPTIVSRCQTISPLPMQPQQIEALLIEQHNFDPQEAVLAAQVCGGWLDVALELDRGFIAEVRRFLAGAAGDIRRQLNLDLAERFMQLCRDTGGSGKHLRLQVAQALEMLRYLWRDALTYKLTERQGRPDVVWTIAGQRTSTKLMEDLSAIGSALESVRANAGLELVLENMFLSIAAVPATIK